MEGVCLDAASEALWRHRSVETCYGQSVLQPQDLHLSLMCVYSSKTWLTAPCARWQYWTSRIQTPKLGCTQTGSFWQGKGRDRQRRAELGLRAGSWGYRGCSVDATSLSPEHPLTCCLQDFGAGCGTSATLQDPVVVGVLSVLNHEVHGLHEQNNTPKSGCIACAGSRAAGREMLWWGQEVLGIAVLHEISHCQWSAARKHWKYFQAFKVKQALGSEEVIGTRSPCLVEQRLQAEAGREWLFSFPTWKSLSFFSTSLLNCALIDARGFLWWKSSCPHPTRLIGAV